VTPEQLDKAIRKGCSELGLTLTDEEASQCAQLLEQLERWSKRVNLTAIRDLDGMISGHLLDSLAVLPYLHGDTVIDIGTGAGFPGLPLAIACPERDFVLHDSNGKKIGFVQHVVTRLALDNVKAVKSRAEDYAPGRSFDTVIARALATIPRILEMGAHLASENGVVLALKGKYPAEELEQTKLSHKSWNFTADEISVPGLSEHARHIISLERMAE
jgi:16S rRNA (guanine527-N7)-methyltransferase